jgi:hypothetical protein
MLIPGSPNGWPQSFSGHRAYHGRSTPRNLEHHLASVLLPRRVSSFSGGTGGEAAREIVPWLSAFGSFALLSGQIRIA